MAYYAYYTVKPYGGQANKMKKLAAILLTILSIGIFHAATASAAVASWQKTVIIQPRGSEDFASASFNQSVTNALNDGANYISLVIPLHQSNIYSTDVQSGWDTPSDQSLRTAAAFIHSKGAHVIFNVHDNPYDGQWRAMINPGDRNGWFTNYGNQLVHYAGLAQANGVEEMVLGTELSSMTRPDYNSSNTSNWQAMIQRVRGQYGGALTYSAQHDGYMSDLQNLGFWGQLDYIGISAYYGLGGGTPSVDSIKGTWDYWNNQSIRNIANQYGKKVLFTEVGYQSKSNSLSDPGASYGWGGGVDLTVQANAYQGLLEYWNNYSYMNGAAFWDWSSDPNAGGTNNVDYTPQGKPAEQIMKQWFTNPSSGTGGSGPTQPSGPTTYSASASAGSQPTAGNATTVSAKVAASQQATGMLVDVEIYNAQGQKVLQKFYDNQTLSTAQTTFSFSWTPSASGQYTVAIGVFTANWQSNPYWNAAAGTIAVGTQPSSGGSGGNTGGTTTPPPASNNISIWWPSAGTPVSGVQPFKALIDGRDLNTYAMYWQVGNGALNSMGTVNDGAAHKEALVDLSGWNWSSDNRYTITFVAKDQSGAVITSKSVVITVTH